MLEVYLEVFHISVRNCVMYRPLIYQIALEWVGAKTTTLFALQECLRELIETKLGRQVKYGSPQSVLLVDVNAGAVE